MKYHINPKTGNPGKCSAKITCPFGNDDVHYNSREEAREAYEKINSNVSLQVTKEEARIYNDYRNLLNNLRENSRNRDSRASERKQKALKMVSDKRKISIGEVKRLIRKIDENKGLKHEQAQESKDLFLIKSEYKRLQEKLPGEFSCSLCTNTATHGDNPALIRYRYRYMKEENGIRIPVLSLMCYECSYVQSKFDDKEI